MTLATASIVAAITDHAATLGLFERVVGHEPKNAPGSGLSCVAWCDSIGPARNQSGLAATTALLVFNVRVYGSMLAEPQDGIDPELLSATDALMAAYAADFDLSGLVREVDLLGLAGNNPLAARFGYLSQDGKLFRVATITLPLLINDLWPQAA
jgi:hypothetical protein